MKTLYIYNPHSAIEVELIEKVQLQLGGYVEIVDVSTASDEVRKLVRATPALIIAPDYLQGEELLKDGVDKDLLILAEMYKALEADEIAVHELETNRLDVFINSEKENAIDDYTLSLIEGGLL